MINKNDPETQKFLHAIVTDYLDEVVGKYDNSLVEQLVSKVIDLSNEKGISNIYNIDFAYTLNEAMSEIA